MLKITKIAGIYLLLIVVLASCSENKNSVEKITDILTISSVNDSNTDEIPYFNFTTSDGKQKNLKELTKGKIVFLNFWGTWCPPCRKEIPDIVELTKELENKNFITIGVAFEKNDNNPHKTVSTFVQENSINYINFIAEGQHLQYYGIEYFPTTFILDENGNVLEKIIGGRTKEDFMASINNAFNSKSL